MMYWPGVPAPQPQSQPSAIGSVLTGVSEASRSTGEAYLRLAQARTASFRASIQPVKNSRHRRHRSTSSSYTRSFLKKRRKLRRQISRQVSQPDPSQQDANAVYANDVIEGRSQQAMDDRESNMNDGDEGMCSQQVMDNGESCLRATLSNLSVAEEELCSPAMGDVAASDPREAEELGPQAQTMNSAEIGQRRRAYSVVDEKPINHDEVCFAPSHTRIRKKMISTDLTREHVDQEWARSIKLSSHSVFTSFDEDVSVDPRIDEFLEFAASRGCSCEAWSEMIAAAYPELSSKSLREMLAWLVERTRKNILSGRSTYHSFEGFAGLARLTFCHILQGFSTARFDTTYDSKHNCTEPLGLRLWLDHLSLGVHGCSVWLGTECSSFVDLCLRYSNRRPENKYIGDESREFVRSGNAKMHVTSLIYLVAYLVGFAPCVEQPLTSCQFRIHPLADVLEFTRSKRTATWLGAFGGDTPKGIQLVHTDPSLGALRRKKPRGNDQALCATELRTDGSRAYSGNKIKLKQSQAYPLQFAKHVALLTAGRVLTGISAES